jgi:hypothetical protein
MSRQVLLALALAAGCAAPHAVQPLANARMVSDFGTYRLERVGLLLPVGLRLSEQQQQDVQAACMAEFSAGTAMEIVRLTAHDLEAVPTFEPHRRGTYSAGAILALARRYRLDALLIPTVTDLQVHPPQRLGLSVDLLSAETGQALWSAAVQLDAAQEATRESIEAWAHTHQGDVNDHTWEVILLSPKRFARFAAFHLASLL